MEPSHPRQLLDQRFDVEGRGERHEEHRAAGKQGGKQLEEEDVEGEGGDAGHRLLATEAELGPRRGEEVRQVPVLDQHPLGSAGRARGVDQVGQALRTGLRGENRPLVSRGDGLVDPHQADAITGQARREPSEGQYGVRPRVGEEERQPFARIGRVERQVGAARLPYGEERRHEVGATRQADPHRGLRPDLRLEETAGEGGGAAVELGVGHELRARKIGNARTARNEGDPVGSPPGLHGEGRQHVRWRRPPVGGCGVVPLGEELVPLGGREEGQVGQPAFRAGHRRHRRHYRREEGRELSGPAERRRPVEEVGGVDQGAQHPSPASPGRPADFLKKELEVEIGDRSRHRERL